MLKKKLLVSLVVVQGIFIVLGIIAIIVGVFYKINNSEQNNQSPLEAYELNDVFLIDDDHYQIKYLDGNRAVFKIIETSTNKVIKEIVIEK